MDLILLLYRRTECFETVARIASPQAGLMNGQVTEQTIQLFAERLSYANVVNLAIQLSAPRDHTTSIRQNDGVITLEHAGQLVSISTPAGLSDIDPISYLPNHNETTKTSRLQIEGGDTPRNADQEFESPWSASMLDDQTALECAAYTPTHERCSTSIVMQGRVADWRDLPSTGWAEMMDLWHCHKPHEHEAPSNVNGKGYAAGNTRLARPGIGFVDPLRFLVDKEDCQGIKVSEYTSLRQRRDKKKELLSARLGVLPLHKGAPIQMSKIDRPIS